MHTTVDESTGVRDERVATDHLASLTFQALHRAIEFDGMPAPWGVTFNGSRVDVQLDTNRTADVDDWARRLGAEAVTEGMAHGIAGHQWRAYRVKGLLDGVAVEVWCPADVAPGNAS